MLMPPNSFVFEPDDDAYREIFALISFAGAETTTEPYNNLELTFVYPNITHETNGVVYPASTWGVHTQAWEGDAYSEPSSDGPLTWDASGISAMEVWFGPVPWKNPPNGTYQNVVLAADQIVFHTFSGGEETDIMNVAGEWLPVTYIMISTRHRAALPPGKT